MFEKHSKRMKGFGEKLLNRPRHLSLAHVGRCSQWRIVGSRGPGARTSVGPSAMVRPNVYQLGGAGSPPAGSGPGQSPEGKRILATTYSKLAENQISWSPSTPIIPI